MKTLFALLSLILVGSVFGQIPNSAPPSDPDVLVAHQTAVQFLNTAFSKSYRDAERMMNPNPPEKGDKSSSDFRNERIGAIKTTVESKEKFGPVASRETVEYGKGYPRSERDPDELFYQFGFKVTYSDGRTGGNTVLVMRKNGAYYIERFR